jgi:hypothetical protein
VSVERPLTMAERKAVMKVMAMRYRRAAKAGKAAMLDELWSRLLHRILLEEWAYFRAWNPESERHAG